MRVAMNQLTSSVAFGASSISVLRLPVWSTSSWLMNTQRMSFGLDEAEQVLEVVVPVLLHAGVDDDGLGGPDQHGVQRHGHGGFALALVVVDEERVGSDLGRLVAGLGMAHGRVSFLD